MIAAHLVWSTAVLAAALALARFTPRLTARTRHAIVLAGLAKFVLPATLFAPLARLAGGSGAAVLFLQFVGPHRAAAPAVATTSTSSPWPLVAVIAWGTIAALLLLRTGVRHLRTLRAVRSAEPATGRDVAALLEAMAGIGIAAPLRIVRSPLAAAPAVVGFFRPTVVLPRCADELEGTELRAILTHECAHVARRDNAISAFDSLLGALLWFHPLVTFARRELARLREQACDEAVADAHDRTDAYLTALSKICRAAIAPPVAGVSCMASGQLNERIEHLMSYSNLKSRALRHYAVVATIVVAIAVVTAASAIAAAPAARPAPQNRYRLTYYTVPHADRNQVTIYANIYDTQEKKTIFEPRITTPPGVTASIRTGSDDPAGQSTDFFASFSVGIDGSGTSTLVVSEQGVEVQRTVMTRKEAGGIHDPRFTGTPIALTLKDAEVHDFFRAMSQLTGYEMNVDADVTGNVTIDANETPWDEALDRVCRDNNLAYTQSGRTYHITKK